MVQHIRVGPGSNDRQGEHSLIYFLLFLVLLIELQRPLSKPPYDTEREKEQQKETNLVDCCFLAIRRGWKKKRTDYRINNSPSGTRATSASHHSRFCCVLSFCTARLCWEPRVFLFCLQDLLLVRLSARRQVRVRIECDAGNG